jgi:predicted transcriptional regulator
MNIDAETLKKIRKVYKLSQKEMAALLDVSDGMVHFIETGKRAISKRIHRRIVEEFELTTVKLSQILQVYEQYQKMPQF